MSIVGKMLSFFASLFSFSKAPKEDKASFLSFVTKSKTLLNDLDTNKTDLQERLLETTRRQSFVQRILFFVLVSFSLCVIIGLWTDISYSIEVFENDPFYYLSASVKAPQRGMLAILLLAPFNFLFKYLNILSPNQRGISLVALFFEWSVCLISSCILSYFIWTLSNKLYNRKIDFLESKIKNITNQQYNVMDELIATTGAADLLDVFGKYQHIPGIDSTLKASGISLYSSEPSSTKGTPKESKKESQNLSSPRTIQCLSLADEKPCQLYLPSIEISYRRCWIDRIIDLIMGEGSEYEGTFISKDGMPSSSHSGCYPSCVPVFALICQSCNSHNGMVPFAKASSLVYICPICKKENFAYHDKNVALYQGESISCSSVDSATYNDDKDIDSVYSLPEGKRLSFTNLLTPENGNPAKTSTGAEPNILTEDLKESPVKIAKKKKKAKSALEQKTNPKSQASAINFKKIK